MGPLMVLMMASLRDYCLKNNWDILMVKCLALMKSPKGDFMVVKCLTLYLDMYIE